MTFEHNNSLQPKISPDPLNSRTGEGGDKSTLDRSLSAYGGKVDTATLSGDPDAIDALVADINAMTPEQLSVFLAHHPELLGTLPLIVQTAIENKMVQNPEVFVQNLQNISGNTAEGQNNLTGTITAFSDIAQKGYAAVGIDLAGREGQSYPDHAPILTEVGDLKRGVDNAEKGLAATRQAIGGVADKYPHTTV